MRPFPLVSAADGLRLSVHSGGALIFDGGDLPLRAVGWLAADEPSAGDTVHALLRIRYGQKGAKTASGLDVFGQDAVLVAWGHSWRRRDKRCFVTEKSDAAPWSRPACTAKLKLANGKVRYLAAARLQLVKKAKQATQPKGRSSKDLSAAGTPALPELDTSLPPGGAWEMLPMGVLDTPTPEQMEWEKGRRVRWGSDGVMPEKLQLRRQKRLARRFGSAPPPPSFFAAFVRVFTREDALAAVVKHREAEHLARMKAWGLTLYTLDYSGSYLVTSVPDDGAWQPLPSAVIANDELIDAQRAVEEARARVPVEKREALQARRRAKLAKRFNVSPPTDRFLASFVRHFTLQDGKMSARRHALEEALIHAARVEEAEEQKYCIWPTARKWPTTNWPMSGDARGTGRLRRRRPKAGSTELRRVQSALSSTRAGKRRITQQMKMEKINSAPIWRWKRSNGYKAFNTTGRARDLPFESKGGTLEDCYPGPGTYDPKRPYKVQAKQDSAFATQTKRMIYLRSTPGAYSPGSGEYHPRVTRRASKLTFGIHFGYFERGDYQDRIWSQSSKEHKRAQYWFEGGGSYRAKQKRFSHAMLRGGLIMHGESDVDTSWGEQRGSDVHTSWPASVCGEKPLPPRPLKAVASKPAKPSPRRALAKESAAARAGVQKEQRLVVHAQFATNAVPKRHRGFDLQANELLWSTHFDEVKRLFMEHGSVSAADLFLQTSYGVRYIVQFIQTRYRYHTERKPESVPIRSPLVYEGRERASPQLCRLPHYAAFANMVRDSKCNELVDQLLEAIPELVQLALAATMSSMHAYAISSDEQHARLLSKGWKVGERAVDLLLQPYAIVGKKSNADRKYALLGYSPYCLWDKLLLLSEELSTSVSQALAQQPRLLGAARDLLSRNLNHRNYSQQSKDSADARLMKHGLTLEPAQVEEALIGMQRRKLRGENWAEKIERRKLEWDGARRVVLVDGKTTKGKRVAMKVTPPAEVPRKGQPTKPGQSSYQDVLFTHLSQSLDLLAWAPGLGTPLLVWAVGNGDWSTVAELESKGYAVDKKVIDRLLEDDAALWKRCLEGCDDSKRDVRPLGTTACLFMLEHPRLLAPSVHFRIQGAKLDSGTFGSIMRTTKDNLDRFQNLLCGVRFHKIKKYDVKLDSVDELMWLLSTDVEVTRADRAVLASKLAVDISYCSPKKDTQLVKAGHSTAVAVLQHKRFFQVLGKQPWLRDLLLTGPVLVRLIANLTKNSQGKPKYGYGREAKWAFAFVRDAALLTLACRLIDLGASIDMDIMTKVDPSIWRELLSAEEPEAIAMVEKLIDVLPEWGPHALKLVFRKVDASGHAYTTEPIDTAAYERLSRTGLQLDEATIRDIMFTDDKWLEMHLFPFDQFITSLFNEHPRVQAALLASSVLLRAIQWEGSKAKKGANQTPAALRFIRAGARLDGAAVDQLLSLEMIPVWKVLTSDTQYNDLVDALIDAAPELSQPALMGCLVQAQAQDRLIRKGLSIGPQVVGYLLADRGPGLMTYFAELLCTRDVFGEDRIAELLQAHPTLDAASKSQANISTILSSTDTGFWSPFGDMQLAAQTAATTADQSQSPENDPKTIDQGLRPPNMNVSKEVLAQVNLDGLPHCPNDQIVAILGERYEMLKNIFIYYSTLSYHPSSEAVQDLITVEKAKTFRIKLSKHSWSLNALRMCPSRRSGHAATTITCSAHDTQPTRL